MKPFSQIGHQLIRDGVSQPERKVPALSPDSVRPDGREMEDFLDFIFQFSRQINFYKHSPDERSGDWTNFFLKSTPVRIALISKYDLEAADRRFLEISEAINESLTFESLNLLLDLGFDLAAQLEQWLEGLQGDESGLRKSIQNLIDTNLSFALKKLLGHANAAGKWNYQRPKNTQKLIKYWSFTGLTEIFVVDRTILQLKGSQKKKVLAAKAILEELALVFLKGIREIVQIAREPNIVEKSLENSAAHEPHLGLMFAFLRLFQQIKGELNSLSQAHLDFFYRKVLRLEELDIIADKAHLVFELAKQADTQLLKQGTLFKAGKDEAGADIFFRLKDEIVVNKATVSSLRTLFIDQEEGTDGSLGLTVKDIYMAPVADSADGQGEAFTEEGTSWETLGSRKSKFFDEDEGATKSHPFARLGCILASPVLLLREGARTVSIKITAENDWPADLQAADFKFFFSGEEGWFEPLGNVSECTAQIECGDEPADDEDPNKVFCLKAELAPTEPPVIFPGADLLEADYGLEQPMVMLVFDHEKARFPSSDGDDTDKYSLYTDLRNVKVCNIDIHVKVCGLRNLVIQNDNSVLDINKPFMPFGPAPKKNSSNFYIGSEEVFSKNWTQFDVNVQWKDLPKNGFAEHYQAYAPYTIPSEANLEVDVSLLHEKDWIEAEPGPTRPLLNAGNDPICDKDGFGHFFHFERFVDFASTSTDIQPCKSFTADGYGIGSQCGFVRFTLGEQDFLHLEYPKVLASSLLALGRSPDEVVGLYNLGETPRLVKVANILDAIDKINTTEDTINDLWEEVFSGTPDDVEISRYTNDADQDSNSARTAAGRILSDSQEVILPNEPYTPTIEAISMDYCASASWDKDVSFLHLYPFEGTYLHQAQGQNPKPSILPPFFNEGTLYVGLSNLTPGSNLNLLFQMAETTADPNVDKVTICWHYLKDNEWKHLKKDFELLSDETDGLIRSGVIELAIPRSISNKETTIMPRGLHWLRATARLRSDAVAETITVHSQAARVEFVPNENNDLQRLDQPLEAGTIAKLAQNNAAIKSLTQYYPAFGGRPKELPETFYTRVSEHLRHKGRAITLYDHERLVLQEFPNIFKVKCITHTMGRRGEDINDYELSPGFVTIVVIPDLRKAKFADPFRPKVTFSTQAAIKGFLKKRLSPFIRLQVLNPKYEDVNLSGDIKFRQGKSSDFYLKQLKEEVALFLAPWANPEQQEKISFGGRIFKSSILNFIEKRSYVDYVVNFEMSEEDGNPVDELAATSARSILVGGEFNFEAYEKESCTAASPRIPGRGIGYTKIKKRIQ